VVVAIIALLVSILLPSLGKAREQAKKSFCANNLGQFGRAAHIYVGEYKYFCPQSPYPQYMGAKVFRGMTSDGWDPCIGWLMTHAMRMTPPAVDTYGAGHFIWYLLNEDELPEIVACPAAKRELMFQMNPEIDTNSLESFMYQYAAFYLTSGTCRSPTTLRKKKIGSTPSVGGANPPIPDPTGANASAHQADNAQGGVPYVWVFQRNGALPADQNVSLGEFACWIQAVEPSQIDNPGRVFYLGDGREYRPNPKGTQYDWPRGTKFDGWGAGWGNQIFLGTRHNGFANMVYLDGHCNSDNQMHHPTWNLAYTGDPNDIRSDQWRVATFADKIQYANVVTQSHHMPQLMVRGWEWFFSSVNK
jgi:prepilin-type processing-associated H-X9-DG protein